MSVYDDKHFYTLTSAEALATLQTDAAAGLTDAEAAQRLQTTGPNRLREKKKKTNLQRFFDQFKDVMILILLAAAVVSFVVACRGEDPMEFFEPLLILLIVVLNAVFGMVQESKAEKALDALKDMSAPHARVLRDGRAQIIDATALVPGDIIHLEAGDFIPADARLLESASLKCEESALTGESLPTEKSADAVAVGNAPLGDRTNMVFSGCSVSYGTATAMVTATGMQTEIGRIADLLQGTEDEQTPLQQKLGQLGKMLGGLCGDLCCGSFGWDAGAGDLYDGHFPGGLSDPRRVASDRDDRAGDRRAAHGQEKCADTQPACGGNAGERVGHLL